MSRLIGVLGRVVRLPMTFWRRLRAWRRIYFTRGGAIFAAGAFAIGFAAMNTGNNLLFLLLGAMLGSIALSSWLSEQTIRDVDVERRAPPAATVGQAARVTYTVHNRKRWIPSLAIEIREGVLPGVAFVPRVDPDERLTVRSENRFVRRGIYPLKVVTLSTSFPFGLFRKERDVERPGELVIWPRTDRSVPAVSAEGERGRRRSLAMRGSPGIRGEFRGLRGYRAGDDPRDIHWRSTARLGEPVVREYERDGSESLWICLDIQGEDEELVESTVEVAASLAARYHRNGRRFALSTIDGHVEPDVGTGQIERVLDALARAEFLPRAPMVHPPGATERCVLVSITGRGATAFGDVIVTGGRAPGEAAETRT